MSALVHSLSVLVAIALAFVWIQIPFLSIYSLQVFAATMALYFIIKRLSQAKLWHVAPTLSSVEMPILTFGFQMLIGATGNFHSLFFPLTFVHLFFLVLATETTTAIVASLGIMFFHYLMTPELSVAMVSQAATIPIVMVFFLFAKHQYQEVQHETALLNTQEQALVSCTYQEHEWRQFMAEFLLPKLVVLEELAHSAQENQHTLQGQLALLQSEIKKMLDKVKHNELDNPQA
ncbi:MAG TPA: hypothetical protein VD999_02000 [Vitreimonas sp.]|nr:hypothetical protein [Vitreimonas sp.]